MFPTSSQKKYWTFADESTLGKFRERTNLQFIKRFAPPDMTPDARAAQYLSADQERDIIKFYERKLYDFCSDFQPPMPNYVIGTAFQYFKRFYIYNSVMDYHPKEIMITCAYLSCKVEEFNVSIGQFVANLSGNRERWVQLILDSELLLMSALKFHLTIHNPYRPVEGFFIDIKTRYSQFDPEIVRSQVEEFLRKVLFTDCFLLYAPSQIALAAIVQSASRAKQPLDSYVTNTLITDKSTLPTVIEAIRTVRSLVRLSKEPPNDDIIQQLEDKLELCRNQENNPDSSMFKLSQDDDLEEEEMNKSFQTNFNQGAGATTTSSLESEDS